MLTHSLWLTGGNLDFAGGSLDAATENLRVANDSVDLQLESHKYELLRTTAGTGVADVGATGGAVGPLRLSDGTLATYESNIGAGTGSIGAATSCPHQVSPDRPMSCQG